MMPAAGGQNQSARSRRALFLFLLDAEEGAARYAVSCNSIPKCGMPSSMYSSVTGTKPWPP